MSKKKMRMVLNEEDLYKIAEICRSITSTVEEAVLDQTTGKSSMRIQFLYLQNVRVTITQRVFGDGNEPENEVIIEHDLQPPYFEVS